MIYGLPSSAYEKSIARNLVLNSDKSLLSPRSPFFCFSFPSLPTSCPVSPFLYLYSLSSHPLFASLSRKSG